MRKIRTLTSEMDQTSSLLLAKTHLPKQIEQSLLGSFPILYRLWEPRPMASFFPLAGTGSGSFPTVPIGKHLVYHLCPAPTKYTVFKACSSRCIQCEAGLLPNHFCSGTSCTKVPSENCIYPSCATYPCNHFETFSR